MTFYLIYQVTMGNIWKMIYWYCNGYFGRDAYSDKQIILEGPTRIVAVGWEEGDVPWVASFDSQEEKQEKIDLRSTSPSEE